MYIYDLYFLDANEMSLICGENEFCLAQRPGKPLRQAVTECECSEKVKLKKMFKESDLLNRIILFSLRKQTK